MSRRGLPLATAAVAGGAVATGAALVAARRTGTSIAGLIVGRIIVPLLFRRRGEAFASLIEADRRRGPVLPGRPLQRRFNVLEAVAGGSRVIRLAPKQSASRLRILYLHGGAYVFDLVPPHWVIIAGLAKRTGADVTTLLYPLAPEHDYRAGIAAADVALDELVAEVGPANVFVAGDSAGGGLALALTHHRRDAGKVAIGGSVLFSPWLDVTVSGPDQPTLAERDPLLTIDRLREAGKLWAGSDDPSAPATSPLFGNHDGIAPVLVLAGGRDLLLSDARRFATAHPSASVREYPGMFHVWMAAPIPEGRHALDEAASFILDHAPRAARD